MKTPKDKSEAKTGDLVRVTKADGSKLARRVAAFGPEYRLLRLLPCGCWTAEASNPKDPRLIGLEFTIGPSSACHHPQGSLGGYPEGTELDWEFVEETPPA